MGDLLDFLITIWDAGEIYEKHGLKGCVLSVLAIIVIIGGIIALAWWLGQGTS